MFEHFQSKNRTISISFPSHALSPILPLAHYKEEGRPPADLTNKPQKANNIWKPQGMFPCWNLDLPSSFCTAGVSQSNAILSWLADDIPFPQVLCGIWKKKIKVEFNEFCFPALGLSFHTALKTLQDATRLCSARPRRCTFQASPSCQAPWKPSEHN